VQDVGKIVAELQVVFAGLGKAQNAAAGAAAKADQVRSRAAQSGFRGVAAGMSRVVEQLKQVQGNLANTAGTVEATVGVVEQVNDDMSPADVVSTLSPAAQKVDAVATGTSAVIKELDGVKAGVAAALRGGQPGPLVAMIDQAKQILVQVGAATDRAKRQTEETINEARQTGNF